MLIVCPGCKTRFSFDETKVGTEAVKLRCSKCQAIFRVVRKSAPSTPPPPAQSAQSSSSNAVKVVVANESAAFCTAVKKVLATEPFDVFTYNDGKEAFAAIENLKPDVVLLDVALPSMYGFEICEAVRKSPELSSIKLVLIASIYDKTRYKRSPKSLYGADDYIEKHHIPDALTPMIYRLVAEQKQLETPQGKLPPQEEATAMPQEFTAQERTAQEASRRELRMDEEEETCPASLASAPELSDAHVKAKRLARIIVSDIVLYNQAKVEEGVKGGTFYELLADDIGEGRSLYERRVPEEVRSGTAYLQDAFEELIARKRRELNL
ncbi:MAG TPA: response regulator [Geobacteraceae bacterium]